MITSFSGNMLAEIWLDIGQCVGNQNWKNARKIAEKAYQTWSHDLSEFGQFLPVGLLIAANLQMFWRLSRQERLVDGRWYANIVQL